jgi:glycosyltransferase involved in cell wall biosynthesis
MKTELLIASGISDLGDGKYECLNNDPQFNICANGVFEFQSGYYKIVLEGENLSNLLKGPRIYFAKEGMFNEGMSVGLYFTPLSSTRHAAYFLLPIERANIRFDPSVLPSNITIVTCQFKRISHVNWYANSIIKILKAEHPTPSIALLRGRQLWSIFQSAGLKGIFSKIRSVSERIDGQRYARSEVSPSFDVDKNWAHRNTRLNRVGANYAPSVIEALSIDGLAPLYAIHNKFEHSNKQLTSGNESNPLKVVFINYGTFNCNSGGHIAHFANELALAGHTVAVCAEGDPATVADFGIPRFKCIEFASVIRNPSRLLDFGSQEISIDQTIIHAWTPREKVRELVESVLSKLLCKYIVHLEDNEDVITASALGIEYKNLFKYPSSFFDDLPKHLSHPIFFRHFLQNSNGVTVIVNRLAEFIPASVPFHILEPGVHAEQFSSELNSIERFELRNYLGVNNDASLLLYPGNMHAANQREVFSLYTAMEILARRGHDVYLIRTGENFAGGLDLSFAHVKSRVIELGFVSRAKLNQLIKISDIFVQPGKSDMFNDYRFPSKIPDFLAAKKPTILPKANIGLRMRHRKDAMLLDRGDGQDIADQVEAVLTERALHDRLGANAKIFAINELNWAENTRKLIAFYHGVLQS